MLIKHLHDKMVNPRTRNANKKSSSISCDSNQPTISLSKCMARLAMTCFFLLQLSLESKYLQKCFG